MWKLERTIRTRERVWILKKYSILYSFQVLIPGIQFFDNFYLIKGQILVKRRFFLREQFNNAATVYGMQLIGLKWIFFVLKTNLVHQHSKEIEIIKLEIQI